MSGKIALDTGVAIKFLNGDEAVDEFLSRYHEIYMPAVVAGELIFGALNSKHAEQNLSRHKKLIQRTRILNITETTANIYAKTRLNLKKKGSRSLKMIYGLLQSALNIKFLWYAKTLILEYIYHLALTNEFTNKAAYFVISASEARRESF